MKYLKRYENHEDIHAICRKYGIRNYTINKDGSINVNNVDLYNCELTEIPLEFSTVIGSFWVNDNNLITLWGSPESTGAGFYCHINNLISLESGPKSVGTHFYCNDNKLTSLVGCPKVVGEDFNCISNQIDTFDGLDFISIGRSFYCDWNPIWTIWDLFRDHTKFEFFNDCDIIRENRVIILDRLNFFLDYIGKRTVTEVADYKCI
jgi:hypothetical protein